MTADNANPDISAFADDPKNMARLYHEFFFRDRSAGK